MANLHAEKQSLRFGIMAEMVGAHSIQSLVTLLSDQIQAAGHKPLVVSCGHNAVADMQAWDFLSRSDCDGIIINSDTLGNDLLARMMSSRPNVVYLNLDHYQEGKVAAMQFKALGHQHIAMVSGPTDRYSVKNRSRGFIEHISSSKNKAGQTDTTDTCNLSIIKTRSVDPAAGADAMRKILAQATKCTAVFFHHGYLASGALNVCATEGVRVPQDISILTCHPTNAPEHLQDILSTICQPLVELSDCAFKRAMNFNRRGPITFASNAVWPSPYPAINAATMAEPNAVIHANRKPTDKPGTDLAPSGQCKLSARECECLEWAAKGKTSWETSQIIGISESTVIYHLRNATRKLNAANRLHAVTKALKASLIDF